MSICVCRAPARILSNGYPLVPSLLAGLWLWVSSRARCVRGCPPFQSFPWQAGWPERRECMCVCVYVRYINSHACHVLLLAGVCAGTASGRRTCLALSPTTVARGGWSRTPRTGSPAPAPPSHAPSASWLSSQAPTSVRPAGRGHRSETGAWRVIGYEVAPLWVQHDLYTTPTVSKQIWSTAIMPISLLIQISFSKFSLRYSHPFLPHTLHRRCIYFYFNSL